MTRSSSASLPAEAPSSAALSRSERLERMRHRRSPTPVMQNMQRQRYSAPKNTQVPSDQPVLRGPSPSRQPQMQLPAMPPRARPMLPAIAEGRTASLVTAPGQPAASPISGKYDLTKPKRRRPAPDPRSQPVPSHGGESSRSAPAASGGQARRRRPASKRGRSS